MLDEILLKFYSMMSLFCNNNNNFINVSKLLAYCITASILIEDT